MSGGILRWWRQFWCPHEGWFVEENGKLFVQCIKCGARREVRNQ